MDFSKDQGIHAQFIFYSILGNFDQILLKIAYNTNNKYISKLIIIKKEKMLSYGYTVRKF